MSHNNQKPDSNTTEITEELSENQFDLLKKSYTQPENCSWCTGYVLKQIESHIGEERYNDIMDRIKENYEPVQRSVDDF